LAHKPINENLSIFGDDLISDVSLKIGKPFVKIPTNNFFGSLDEIQAIDNETNYYRIRGWLFDDDMKVIPKNAFVVNENNQIVGYLLTGFERVDVANAINERAKKSGFYGYVLKKHQGDSLYIVNDMSNKRLKVQWQTPPFSYKQFDKKIIDSIPSEKQIDFTTFQKNKTYDNKIISGFEIYGSFIENDSSKASIKISLNSSNELLYKTGPSTSGQIINIIDNGNKVFSGNLKSSEEWSVLFFEQDTKNIIIEIIDDSSQWGEWSAVAIRSKNESK